MFFVVLYDINHSPHLVSGALLFSQACDQPQRWKGNRFMEVLAIIKKG